MPGGDGDRAGHDAPLDLLILGSGVAGLSAAVDAALRGLRVGIVTKAELDQATTRWAQGGVAAVLPGVSDASDTTDLHLADTLAAGAGLCDVDAVRVLVDEGPHRVVDLIALGAAFDRGTDGRLELAREGGHSLPRIVHAGGAATGYEVERALVEAVRERVVTIHEQCLALDLQVEHGRCVGVTVRLADGSITTISSRHTLLATGGAGQMFAVTTNPAMATGDGIAMALRRGVACADLEFVQFHPTALHHPSSPKPLLSEALRGHGAVLRDGKGDRFVDELLPRDKVARAVVARMLDEGAEHVWLDATGLDQFTERFPTIAAALADVGLDSATDWLPVAPAAHYYCGGVLTDLRGATTLPGLWAAGEVACAGVHGANRLASNSLLDGMVFAPRVVEAIDAGVVEADATGAMRAVLGGGGLAGRDIRLPSHPLVHAEAGALADLRAQLARVLFAKAGVLRSGESLVEAALAIDAIESGVDPTDGSVAAWELRNLLTVARGLAASALARTESRGAHTRTDFPDTDPALAVRMVVR